MGWYSESDDMGWDRDSDDIGWYAESDDIGWDRDSDNIVWGRWEGDWTWSEEGQVEGQVGSVYGRAVATSTLFAIVDCVRGVGSKVLLRGTKKAVRPSRGVG